MNLSRKTTRIYLIAFYIKGCFLYNGQFFFLPMCSAISYFGDTFLFGLNVSLFPFSVLVIACGN